MPTTPVLGLPYPASSDTADVPRDIKALADSLDVAQMYVPVGAVFLWALAAAPAGSNPNGKAAFLFCTGQVVAAADYPKLAALFGAPGGSVTVPDMSGLVPVGKGAPPFDVLGATGGEQQHTLSVNELPVHAHPDTIAYAAAGGHDHPGPGGNPWFVVADGSVGWTRVAIGDNYSVPWAQSATRFSYGRTASAGSHSHPRSGAVGNTGGGVQHNNMPPYRTLNYVMRAA